MQVESISPDRLSEPQIMLWRSWCGAGTAFASPLMQPELVQHVHAVRGDVRVAALADGSGPAAFLPYREQGRAAVSHLDCLQGVQGFVNRPGLTLEPKLLSRVLAGCGLRGLALQSVPQETCFGDSEQEDDYPFIDLSNGFEAYRLERKAAKSDELTTALRKTRKIERELGPLCFQMHDNDADALATLLEWKAEQLEAKQLVNHLAQPWVGSLFNRLLETPSTADFAPVFSTLKLNGELLAASFAVRSRTVLHGWVMAFNSDYYKYSPGSLLLAQILQKAEPLGVERVDMGRGTESYKQSFRSGGFAVTDCSLETRPLLRAATSLLAASKRLVAATPFQRVAREAVSKVRWLLRPRKLESPS